MSDRRRSIFGIVGCGISSVAYLLAGKPFYRIYQAGVVEEKFQPFAELLAALSSFLWMYYSLPFLKKNNDLFMVINGFGFLINLAYLVVFCRFTAKRRRFKLVYAIATVVAFTAVLIAIAMFLLTSHTVRLHYVAVLGDIGSLVSSLYSLLSWRSVSLSELNHNHWALPCDIVGSLIWTLYALQSPIDNYIVAANGVRVVFGAVKMILYAYMSDALDSEVLKPSECTGLPPKHEHESIDSK